MSNHEVLFRAADNMLRTSKSSNRFPRLISLFSFDIHHSLFDIRYSLLSLAIIGEKLLYDKPPSQAA